MSFYKDQYINAYPNIKYDESPSAANGFGWHGKGYGWQIDFSKLKPDPASSSTEKTEDTTVNVEEEMVIKASLVENVEAFFGEKGSGLTAKGDIQDFNKIRDFHYKRRTLFEDPQFPCTNRSLYYSSNRPIRHHHRYKWLRPGEICDDPNFFVKGYSRFDVQQGELGNCWLLVAIANITMYHNLFFQVVPKNQSLDEKYAGVFHFMFWQYEKWIDVVIDDRLPTINGKLVFMRSTNKNEFWSALLEKAYAKLHGSYEALKGGSACEAFEDFTGGVSEMYELEKPPPHLFKILKIAYERGSLMGCSIQPDPQVTEKQTPQGLVKGHSYSITKVAYVHIETGRVRRKIPLVRIRNPWGNGIEWNGPWSDQSTDWSSISTEVKESMGVYFENDGEFWMSYRDLKKYFTRVEICNLTPDSLTEDESNKKWFLSIYEGEWVRGGTAGGCRNYIDTFANNPQYRITLIDPDEDDEGKCTLILSLMQKNRRQKRDLGLDVLTIGFALYYLSYPDRVPKPLDKSFFRQNQMIGKCPRFINLREVSCRFRLPPGTYCIIPSTFEPDEEGEFLLRIFSGQKNEMEDVFDEDASPPLPPPRHHRSITLGFNLGGSNKPNFSNRATFNSNSSYKQPQNKVQSVVSGYSLERQASSPSGQSPYLGHGPYPAQPPYPIDPPNHPQSPYPPRSEVAMWEMWKFPHEPL